MGRQSLIHTQSAGFRERTGRPVVHRPCRRLPNMKQQAPLNVTSILDQKHGLQPRVWRRFVSCQDHSGVHHAFLAANFDSLSAITASLFSATC